MLRIRARRQTRRKTSKPGDFVEYSRAMGAPAGKPGRPKRGVEMRVVAVFIAICALSQTALAQTPDCKAITDTAARLACYDKVAPAAAAKSGPPTASADKNAKP